MPFPDDISNTATLPSYNNVKTYNSKHLDTLGDFTWYSLVQDTQTYIVTQLPSTKPRLAHYISTAINFFAKKNHLEIHASYQTKNNLLYLSEEDFKAYFEAMKTIQPTIKEATQELKYLFDDNQISSVNTADRNYLAQLPDFTWYQIEQDNQTYIVTELPSSRKSLANNVATAINHYAKEKALPFRASCQQKNNLLFLIEASFKYYFKSLAQNPPAANQPSTELIAKFSMNGKKINHENYSLASNTTSRHLDNNLNQISVPPQTQVQTNITTTTQSSESSQENPVPQLSVYNEFDFEESTIKIGKSKYLNLLTTFTWYYLVQDSRTYIITQLPSTKPTLAHNVSIAINRFAKTKHLSIHASSQKKNNLLYFYENDFIAYFDARNITQPTIKEATQELKDLFIDNQPCSVSTADRNYLARLPSFTWYQFKRDTLTFIVTELPSNTPTLANHIADAINHYAKANALQLHASCQRKINLLYLTESCFISYFSSINQKPPVVNQPSAALIAKFAPNPRKKHTANTLNKRISPINSSDTQPEGLVTSEPQSQLPNLEATQSSLLDQLSDFISGNNNNPSMTIVQSGESLTEDCAPAFDDFYQFDFNGLYHALGLNEQAQDGNNRVDEIENSSVDLRQIHLCPQVIKNVI